MEQFSLDKYLENPNRKVVTRRGNSVRIICTDRKHGEDELPIVFLEQCRNGEFLLACRKDGRSDSYDTPYDLFFADEEEELTEFEKAVQSICINLRDGIDDISDIRVLSNNLLDLVKKELMYEKGFREGEKYALKNLPKWKKATEDKKFDKHVCVMDYYMVPFLDTEVNEGDYYIELSDLKTLPKEE